MDRVKIIIRTTTAQVIYIGTEVAKEYIYITFPKKILILLQCIIRAVDTAFKRHNDNTDRYPIRRQNKHNEEARL